MDTLTCHEAFLRVLVSMFMSRMSLYVFCPERVSFPEARFVSHRAIFVQTHSGN